MRRATQARAYKSFANEMRHARKAAGKARRQAFYRGARKSIAWTSTKGWTHRRRLAPFYIAIGLQIAGAILAAARGGTRTAALCAFIGAGMLWWADHRNRSNADKIGHDGRTHRAWPTFRRCYYAATYVAAAACLLTMARIGAGPPMPGVLGACALVAGVPWWWHNRVRTDPAVALDDRMLIWQTVVTAPNGVLPAGTDLLAVAPVTLDDLDPAAIEASRKKRAEPIGWSARVQLPPGKGTTAKIVAATADIAACYDLPVDAVIAEPTLDRSARSARLLVLDRHNPTYDTALYDESWAVLVDGCYPTGVFPDGTRAWRRLYKPLNGPVHELYSGDSGSGKSRGMEAAITQSAMTGLVIPFVGDPQGGQSMPAWAGVQGKAVWAARSIEEITDVCYAVFRLMMSRSERLTRREWVDEDGVTRIGLDYHDPLVVPDMPIVEFSLDEAHALLDIDEIAGLIEQIAKMSRKTGIRLRLGTQYPSISDLGNRMGIRNQLVAGNIVSYRISTRVTSGMIMPSWAPNPFDIPPMTPDGKDTAGTCVAISSAPNGTRPAFQRGVWVKNAHRWADIAVSRIPEFGPEDLAALGDDFANRHGRGASRSTTGAELMKSDGAKPTTAPIVVPSSRTVRARILEYLTAHGRAHTGVVAAALDISKGTASKTLRRLEDDGLVVGVRRGIWATPDNNLDEEEASA